MTKGQTTRLTLGALEKLPEPYARAGTVVVGWAEKNPGRAVIYGAAGGFLVGFLGVARVLTTLQLIHSVRKTL